LYPVYILEDDTVIPKEGEFYIVCGNGTWFRKETEVFSGFIPVASIPFLKDFEVKTDEIKWALPKVPHDIVMKVKQFFVRIFKKYTSEACIILDYRRFGEVHSPIF
jgi:hypothetical protein